MIAQIVPAWRMPLHLSWLDYEVPQHLEPELMVGQLVKMPFRSGFDYGVVKTLTEQSPSSKLKPLTEIINPSPVFSSSQLTFLEEIATLYQTSLGFLVKCSLFALQKSKVKQFSQTSRTEIPVTTFVPAKPRTFTHTTLEERVIYLTTELDQTTQSLILVPEIADSELIIKKLPASFQKKVATITGELGVKDYAERWLQIWRGKKTIIVGTRAALYAPFFNLQQIFLLDEAHPSHKSFDMAPRFHTRDAALLLTTHHHAQLHLLCHTPSVENYYFTEKNIFAPASNKQATRHHTSPASYPEVRPLKSDHTVLIHQTSRRKAAHYSPLSETLLEKIATHEEGILFLFMHQRGSAHYIFCRDCNQALLCPNCGSSFTYRARTKIVTCHACKFTREPFTFCPACRGNSIIMYGTGTEAVEAELRELFPQKFITCIDSDNKKYSLTPHQSSLLIGTQFAWNKLEWDRVKLMAFVDADTPLFIPEYKTHEHLWYTLRDAQYRLPSDAELLIQTSKPEHVVFSSLTQPTKFYSHELLERKKFRYPPYAYLVKLFLGTLNQTIAELEAQDLYRRLSQLTKLHQTITISQPLALKPYFTQRKYWQAIIVKVEYRSYKRDIKWLLAHIPPNWKVDLNPNSLLGH